MAENNTIKQFLSGLLLLVFTFSITPRQFLHDAIADHKDKIASATDGKYPQVSYAGFMCKCDNLVAESPFIHKQVYFNFIQEQVFSAKKSISLYHYYSSGYFFFEHRGPPAQHIMFI